MYILIIFLLNLSAFAFNGFVEYEIFNENGDVSRLEGTLVLSISKDKFRFERNYLVNKTTPDHIVVNFSKSQAFDSKSKTIWDLNKRYQNKSFMEPEEFTSTENTKKLNDIQATEFESFYFDDLTRLRISGYYSGNMTAEKFKPIWYFFERGTVEGLINFLIHPINKQLAIELKILKKDKSYIVYKLKKSELKNLPDSVFSFN